MLDGQPGNAVNVVFRARWELVDEHGRLRGVGCSGRQGNQKFFVCFHERAFNFCDGLCTPENFQFGIAGAICVTRFGVVFFFRLGSEVESGLRLRHPGGGVLPVVVRELGLVWFWKP